jgi:hypothetical protein
MRPWLCVLWVVIGIVAVACLCVVWEAFLPGMRLAIFVGGSSLGVVTARLLGWHKPATSDPDLVLASGSALKTFAAAVAGIFAVLTGLATWALVELWNGSPDGRWGIMFLLPVLLILAVMTVSLGYLASRSVRRRPSPPAVPPAHVVRDL